MGLFKKTVVSKNSNTLLSDAHKLVVQAAQTYEQAGDIANNERLSAEESAAFFAQQAKSAGDRQVVAYDALKSVNSLLQ